MRSRACGGVLGSSTACTATRVTASAVGVWLGDAGWCAIPRPCKGLRWLGRFMVHVRTSSGNLRSAALTAATDGALCASTLARYVCNKERAACHRPTRV
jgi:hypothetical protein